MEPKGLLRRVSHVLIARPLSKTGVQRDHLTIARLLAGVLAAVMLALGPAGFWLAAPLLVVGVILQRTGSEMSEIIGPNSAASDRCEGLSDSVSNALAFFGLGVGLRFGEHGLATIAMGVFAGIAVAVIPWLIRRLAVIDGKRPAEFDGIAGLDADDIMLIFPVALWVGWQEGLLLVTAFAAPTFALAFFTTHYRKFSASSDFPK